jgi:hypothetical protein
MALTPGTRLGSYEVLSALGEGGMGQVYRARDTRLNRDVAVKVLSDAVIGDPDRVSRFQREAQVLASLNHPNIAHLYGFEETPAPCLVMELVEGPTLADLIATGQPEAENASHGLKIDDVIGIGKQIAEALEVAHEAGIIHRDLKPANIKVKDDGTVKVLDFGLAKALAADSGGATAGAMNSPTLTARATQLGVILGTAAYMSPEQAKGRAVDRRADIWAFGVVLHEMLTGDRPFKGEDISDTLAAVLRQEVSFAALPAGTPPRLKRLLERCLDRDIKTRLRDIGEARIELARLMSGGPDATDTAMPATAAVALPTVARARTRLLPWIAGALAGIIVATATTWWIVRPAPPEPLQPIRFSFVPPVTSAIGLTPSTGDRVVAISPNGKHIAWVTVDGTLMVRAIDQLDAEPIRGIAGARIPFFSPDSLWIGFFQANSEIRKVSVTGGPSVPVCSTNGAPRGAAWGSNNTIVFATGVPTTGLMSVPAGGGEPTVLTKPDSTNGLTDHFHPFVLPGGQILFTIVQSNVENAQVAVLDPQSGNIKILVRGGSQAEYVRPAGGPGYLVYGASGSLRAVSFDPDRLEVTSDPRPVVDQVAATSLAAVEFGVSRTGTLVYVPGGVLRPVTLSTLVWKDRQGRDTPVKAEPRGYYTVHLSPDGTRAALDIRDQQNDVWIWHFARETLTPLTFDPAIDGFPLWTPDSRSIIFSSTRGAGPYNMFIQAADGTGTSRRLATSINNQVAFASVTPDGGRLVVVERTGVNDDIGLWSTDKPVFSPLINGATPERNPDLSPDGKWLAFESYEATPPQVYVRPFPDVNGGRWQISKDGGVRPVWSKNGKELFFLSSPSGATVSLYAVAIPTTPDKAINPVKLFDVPNLLGQQNGRFYDVARDGRFIFINTPKDQLGSPAPPVIIVANWFEELKAKAGDR